MYVSSNIEVCFKFYCLNIIHFKNEILKYELKFNFKKFNYLS
jgi:hypothetical protein